MQHMKRVSVQLPDDLHVDLVRQSISEHRSVSQVVVLRLLDQLQAKGPAEAQVRTSPEREFKPDFGSKLPR